ncbi:hypothetical protein [Porphyromonas gingivicanis]|uniref:hypothetical protein n=1 Tax=Porphyromonas gingivicanis TaxID=266762 RepID=UPI000A49239F|nr:hypothetical protein [Porphyromonas gingivicanis]
MFTIAKITFLNKVKQEAIAQLNGLCATAIASLFIRHNESLFKEDFFLIEDSSHTAISDE